MLRQHLNFRQNFLIGLHRVLSIPLFNIWTAHIICIEIWFKSVKVLGWTPLKILIFCIERWNLLLLRFSEKCRAISHWMGVPKSRGKWKSATISLHRGDSLSMSSVVCISNCTKPIHPFYERLSYPRGAWWVIIVLATMRGKDGNTILMPEVI